MTKFLDGPAANVVLMLKRAPLYLRAVQAPDGNWDALDQLADSPEPTEKVVAYKMTAGPFRAHLNMGRKGCFWAEGGEYRVVADQPTGDVLRSTTAWRDWCREQVGTAVAEDGSFVHEAASQ